MPPAQQRPLADDDARAFERGPVHLRHLALGWPLPLELGFVEGVLFADGASAWDGRLFRTSRAVEGSAAGRAPLLSAGCGMRFNLGAIVLKLDWARLYDTGTGVCLAIAGPGVRGGRVVDDFVNLTDLAPTFLETGGVAVPEVMTGRSLWPVLKSDRQGLVDPQRTFVVTGRERHVEMARAGHLPYPQRAIRTADYLLIINFKPDRYPLGDPYGLDSPNPPTAEELTEITFVTLPDDDAGPTKAWLVGQRDNPQWKPLFDLAYGKRPREEL